MCASPAAGEPVVCMNFVRTQDWRRENEVRVITTMALRSVIKNFAVILTTPVRRLLII